MKEKVLIIRSVSFQQLDQNLAAIVKEFPPESFQLHLLTHRHGMERAQTYDALSNIIDYEHRGNFTLFHLPSTLKKTGYDTVIVPVTNKTGLGFLNVLALAFRIRSMRIMVCNMVSELRQVSRASILLRGVKAVLFSLIAGLGTLVVGVVLSPYLLIRLVLAKKRKNTNKE